MRRHPALRDRWASSTVPLRNASFRGPPPPKVVSSPSALPF